MNLHIIMLYLYRFVQYIILYSIIATLLGLLVKRMSDDKISLIPVVEEELTPELNQKIQEKKEEGKRKRKIV